MVDAQQAKNRHAYLFMKASLNKMFEVHRVHWDHSNYDVTTSKQITPGRNAMLLMIQNQRVDGNVQSVSAEGAGDVKCREP